MRKPILLIIILSTTFIAGAQVNGSVKGKLLDTSARQSIAEATVSVILAKDSSLTSFTLSDKKGAFEIKNLDAGKYLLMVSHTGFENFKKTFSISADKKDN